MPALKQKTLLRGSYQSGREELHRPLMGKRPPTKQKTPFQESFPVGARGFEPPTSCTPCKRASRAAPRPDLSGRATL